MVYQELDTVNSSQDITQLFVYVNNVTGDIFGFLTVISFFMVVFGSTYFAQVRMTGRGKVIVSFAVSSLVTLPVAIFLNLMHILSTFYLVVCCAIAVVGIAVLWLAGGPGEQ